MIITRAVSENARTAKEVYTFVCGAARNVNTQSRSSTGVNVHIKRRKYVFRYSNRHIYRRIYNGIVYS